MGMVFETFRGKDTADKATLAGLKRKAKWRRIHTLVPPHDTSTIDVLAVLFQGIVVARCFRCLWGLLQHRTSFGGNTEMFHIELEENSTVR